MIPRNWNLWKVDRKECKEKLADVSWTNCRNSYSAETWKTRVYQNVGHFNWFWNLRWFRFTFEKMIEIWKPTHILESAFLYWSLIFEVIGSWNSQKMFTIPERRWFYEFEVNWKHMCELSIVIIFKFGSCFLANSSKIEGRSYDFTIAFYEETILVLRKITTWFDWCAMLSNSVLSSTKT